MSHDLPPSPPDFQRIGWRGFSIILPQSWNLRLHDGNERAGALIFADLRETRLEVRWQQPRAFPHTTAAIMLQRRLAKLRKRQPGARIHELTPAASRIDQPRATTILIAASDRLYELHWPKPEHVPEITNDFLHSQTLLQNRPDRFWSLYGATGWIPASATLKKTSLLPGATTLIFAGKAHQFTLGSVSLADRLLAAHTSLRAWATAAIPLIARHPAGIWHETPAETAFTAPTRRHLRPATHRLTLQHDSLNNRICWRHHLGPTSG